jgi:hypothetical protein
MLKKWYTINEYVSCRCFFINHFSFFPLQRTNTFSSTNESATMLKSKKNLNLNPPLVGVHSSPREPGASPELLTFYIFPLLSNFPSFPIAALTPLMMRPPPYHMDCLICYFGGYHLDAHERHEGSGQHPSSIWVRQRQPNHLSPWDTWGLWLNYFISSFSGSCR